MENDRFLACLDADYRRMHDIAAGGDLSSPVPSCPDWTLKDLVEHTAMVYLHKVKATELGGEDMADWPPDISGRPTLDVFENAYAQLTNMFATHDPSDHSGTWYDPDQTVGFWIRRMAQETVIHRRDAELAVGDADSGRPRTRRGRHHRTARHLHRLPDPQVEQGIQPALEPSDGDSLLVDAGGARWLATIGLGGVEVSRMQQPSDATVQVSGAPSDVLFWLWNRTSPADGSVDVQGDDATLERLRNLLTLGTQ